MDGKTVRVKVEGKREVENLSKAVSNLKKTVLSTIAEMNKLGGSKNSPVFSVRVKVNRASLAREIKFVQSQLNSLKLNIKVDSSLAKAIAKQTKGKDLSIKSNTGDTAKIAKSLQNVNSEVNSVTKSLNKLDSTYARIQLRLASKERLKLIDPSAISDAKQLLKYVEKLNNPNFSKSKVPISDFGNSKIIPRTPSGQYASFNQKALLQVRQSILGNPVLNKAERKFLSSQLGNLGQPIPSTSIKSFTDYINALDGVKNALDSSVRATNSFITTTTKLGALNPAKQLLNGFKEVNKEIISMNLNIAKFVGNNAVGNIKSVFNTLGSVVKKEFSGVAQDTIKIGDAISIFDKDMESLKINTKDANKIKRELGEYGKQTVYDTSDLLKVYSTLTAYGRKDQMALAKALGGLTAQTNNPVDNYKEAVAQISDILSAGKLNQTDFRIFRNRLNALGSAELNSRLTALAKSKGYGTITEATQDNGISSEEFLDLLKAVGGSKKFQNRASSILTPRQAIDNLRETLSLNFNYDKYDENGNKIADAPLKHIYNQVTKGIKDIGKLLDTDRFTGYVSSVTSIFSRAIDGIYSYSKIFNQYIAKDFLAGLDKFNVDFNKALSDFNINSALSQLFSSLTSLFQDNGERIGKFANIYIEQLTLFTSNLVKIADELLKGGFLEGINGVMQLYNAIAVISVKSGAVKVFAEQFSNMFKVLNNIVSVPANIKGFSTLVESVGKYLTTFFKMIDTLGTKTNAIPTILNSISKLFNFFDGIIKDISSKVGTKDVNNLFSNLGNAINNLLDGLRPIYANLGSALLKFGASDGGKKLMNAFSDFIIAMTKNIENAIRSFGNGSLDKGLEKIASYIESILSAVAKVSNVISSNYNKVLGAVIAVKVFSGILSVIRAYTSFMKNMEAFERTSLGSKMFGVGRLAKNKFTQRVPMEAGYGISGVPTTGSVGKLGKGARLFRNASLIGVADLGVQTVNGMVQSSNANNTVKNLSQSVGTVANFTSTGALLGSVLPGVGTGVGALVGGVAGVGKALYDWVNDNRAKVEEQKREAKMTNKQVWDGLISSIKETNQATSSLATSQIEQQKVLKKDLDGLNSALDTTFTTIGQNGKVGLDGVKASLQSLGYNYKIPVKNINDLYVKVGNDIINWKHLKESKGIKDDETLMASLNASSVALGEYHTTLVDSNGNVVKTINAFTQSEQKNRDARRGQIVDSLTKLGLSKNELETKTLEDLASFKEGLKEVLNTPFKTDNDQMTALKEFILKFNPSADVANKSLQDLIQMSNDIEKTITKDSPEDLAQQKVALLERLKELGVNVKGKAKEYAQKSIESLEREVNEFELTGGDEGAKDILPFLQEAFKGHEEILHNKTKGVIKDVVEKYNLAVLNYSTGDTQGGDEAVNAVMELLGSNDEALRAKLREQLQKAGEKLKEGSDKVKPNEVSGIDTSNVGTQANNLKDKTKGSIDKSASKLREGSSQASVDLSQVNVKSIGDEARALGSKIASLADKVWSKINAIKSSFEIPSFSLPIGRKSKHKFDGGIVRAYRQIGGVIPSYHSRGGLGGIDWKPRGTDTVPAMLTPGEYVIRKKAVQSLGLNFLNKLNNGGVKPLPSNTNTTIINNVYNNNNAQVSQNINNQSGYLNAMSELDKLMRYV